MTAAGAKVTPAAMVAAGVNKVSLSTCADKVGLQLLNRKSARARAKANALSKASVSLEAVGQKSPSPKAATAPPKEAPSEIVDASSPAPLHTTVSASSALSCSSQAKEVKEDDLKHKQGDVGATEEDQIKGPDGSQSLHNQVDCELVVANQKAKALARLATKAWKLKKQLDTGKKLNAGSQPTGRDLTSDEILKITAELANLVAAGGKATPAANAAVELDRKKKGTKAWKLKRQIDTGKKLNAGSQPTGRDLTSEELSKITAEFDKLVAAGGKATPAANAAVELNRKKGTKASKRAPSELVDACSLATLDTTVSASSALLPAAVGPSQTRKRHCLSNASASRLAAPAEEASTGIGGDLASVPSSSSGAPVVAACSGNKGKIEGSDFMRHHNNGKLQEASGLITGCGLADGEVARINDEIDGFKTEREEINEEREHGRVVAIKLETKKVGMELCKLALLIPIHSNRRTLEVSLPAACTEKSGESNDRMYLDQCVVVDGLSYIIHSAVSVKDPERPGNTTKENFLLLNTVVDDHKGLLSMCAIGRGPRSPKDKKNGCHKNIPTAYMKEQPASIFQAGAAVVVEREPNNPAPAAGVSSTHVAAPAVSAETNKSPVHDLAQQPADQAASVEQAGASGPASTDPSNTEQTFEACASPVRDAAGAGGLNKNSFDLEADFDRAIQNVWMMNVDDE
jgi:hypothetical protein